MKQIIKLSEKQIQKTLKEARKELKKVCSENEEHWDDLDNDAMEMAEEAIERRILRLEEKLYIVKNGKPVYAVVDIAKKRSNKCVY